MDDKGANIDLIFRNGLKDYEVLPPPEVWENIHPVVSTGKKSVIALRAAASVAVLMSVSLFAYWYSRPVTAEHQNEVTANNDAFFAPENVQVAVRSLPVEVRQIPINPALQKTLAVINKDPVQVTESQNIALDVISSFQNAGNISLNNSGSLHGPSLASVTPGEGKSLEINKPELQYTNSESPSINTGHWSIAAMASPTYYSTFNSGNNELSKQLMASEQPLISYSGGVAVSYKVNKRISIQSGIYYSSLGQVIDGISSFGGFQKYDNTKGARNFEVVTSGGIIYTTNPDVFLIGTGEVPRVMTVFTNDVFDPGKARLQALNTTLRQNFSYLEFPVVMRYKFIDKVIDFNLIGGLSTNMLVNNSAYAVVNGGKYSIGTTEGVNPVTISSSFGMGMEYNISDKFALNVEPTVRYYLNPGTGLAGSNIHPYSFGIFSGISYKF